MFQDGGLLNNNPTSLAVHEARCLWPDRPISGIVSIGTGRPPVADSKAWSFTGATLLASATDTERPHQVLEDVYPEDVYYRFNVEHELCAGPMDVTSAEALVEYRRIARDYCEANHARFEQLANRLSGADGEVAALEEETPQVDARGIAAWWRGRRRSAQASNAAATAATTTTAAADPAPSAAACAARAELAHRHTGALGGNGACATAPSAVPVPGGPLLADEIAPARRAIHHTLRLRLLARLVGEDGQCAGLSRFADAVYTASEGGHERFARVMTFMSWLHDALLEASDSETGLADARDGWLRTQPLSVISRLEEPYMAFLRDAGLSPAVPQRAAAGRARVAVRVEPLLPPLRLPLSAHTTGAPVGAVNEAICDALRWAASAITHVKEAVAQSVLGSETRALPSPCATAADHALGLHARTASSASAANVTSPSAASGGGSASGAAAPSSAAAARVASYSAPPPRKQAAAGASNDCA
mmetsp:Transcript_15232/g.39594  ORF Transcript_15232/g.39594 Transcript_15232/m.39594 type:complete len:477 (-) Transcript_15232:125-1555(-)|eukprot:CAMPEP_0119419298 /NCGR_PEP_ID=MMETSP1335-20130426/20429_1 /TAXON_ID=259385 /ORGANISM="Chrysoculter rhomboideus, Strain RCC1486" /LENGTH=476 /DNA_ID=CAMNT_0007444593 /DNA_START=331 /DNA_END=1761 /DNA_ORIENTATION=+